MINSNSSVLLVEYDGGNASLCLNGESKSFLIYDLMRNFEWNGYDWNSLALVFLEEKLPDLKDVVNFDSQAGLFYAYY